MSLLSLSAQAARSLHRPTTHFGASTVAARAPVPFVVLRRYSDAPAAEAPIDQTGLVKAGLQNAERRVRERKEKKEKTWWQKRDFLCKSDRKMFERKPAEERVATLVGVFQALLAEGQLLAALQIFEAYGPCGLTPSAEDKEALIAACVEGNRKDLAVYLQNIYPREYHKWEQLSLTLSQRVPIPAPAAPTPKTNTGMCFIPIPPPQPAAAATTTTTTGDETPSTLILPTLPLQPPPQKPERITSDQTQAEEKKRRAGVESDTSPSSSSESSGEEGSGSGEESEEKWGDDSVEGRAGAGGVGLNGTGVSTTTRDMVAATMNRIAQKGEEAKKALVAPVKDNAGHLPDEAPPIPQSEQEPAPTTPLVEVVAAAESPTASISVGDENRDQISPEDEGLQAERHYPGVFLGTPRPRPVSEEMQAVIEKTRMRKVKTLRRDTLSKYNPTASPAIKAAAQANVVVGGYPPEAPIENEDVGSAQSGWDMIRKRVREGDREPRNRVGGDSRGMTNEEKKLWGGDNNDFF